VSTEDGRILFYNTSEAPRSGNGEKSSKQSKKLGSCAAIGQLGGNDVELSTRIKDFEILSIKSADGTSTLPTFLVVTGSSDGAIRVWSVGTEELESPDTRKHKAGDENIDTEKAVQPRQVGRMLGAYETNNRITCLKSFVLTGDPEEETNGNGPEDLEQDDDSEEDSDEDSDDETHNSDGSE
jgi:protein MAK11